MKNNNRARKDMRELQAVDSSQPTSESVPRRSPTLKKSRGVLTGRYPTSMFASFTYEAVRACGEYSMLMSTCTQDINTNVTTLSDNLVEIALRQAIDSAPGADVFRDTELDSYADYVIYMLAFLVEMRAMKFLIDVHPAVARNDAAAGSPLTRASWNGLSLSVMGLHVPLLSLKLAELLSTPIILWPGNPIQGYPDMIFYPMFPSTTLSNLESYLSSAAGEYDGLAGANQLRGLGRPMGLGDIQYRTPELLHTSRMARVYQAYLPARDDANQSYQVRDNTWDIIFDRLLGIGSEMDYAPLLGVGATAGYDFLVNTAGAAGKVNLKYATIGDATIYEVSDFVADPGNWTRYAGWLFQQHNVTAASTLDMPQMPPFVRLSNAFPAGEGAILRRVIQAMVRDLRAPELRGPGLISRSTRPFLTKLGVTGMVPGGNGSIATPYFENLMRDPSSGNNAVGGKNFGGH